jgi:hypothetical protein
LTRSKKSINFVLWQLIIITVRRKSNKKGQGNDKETATIEERIGRSLKCECELLNDVKAIRRKELHSLFGVDFGEAGKREVDVV